MSFTGHKSIPNLPSSGIVPALQVNVASIAPITAIQVSGGNSMLVSKHEKEEACLPPLSCTADELSVLSSLASTDFWRLPKVTAYPD